MAAFARPSKQDNQVKVSNLRWVSGCRRYDRSVLGRLAIIQRARECDFTLEEIRQLFFGFGDDIRPTARWRKLAMKKLAELDERSAQIKSMRGLILRWQQECNCSGLEECGQRLLAKIRDIPARDSHVSGRSAL